MLGISADPAFSAAMDPPSGGLCEEQRVLWAALFGHGLSPGRGAAGWGPPAAAAWREAALCVFVLLTPVFSFADPAILQDAGSQEEQPRRAYLWPGEART